jgi:hypothetical protein
MTDRKFDVWEYPYDGKKIKVEIRIRRYDGAPSECHFDAKHQDPLIDETDETLIGLGKKIEAALDRASKTTWTPYLHVKIGDDFGRLKVEYEAVDLGVVRGTLEPPGRLYRHGREGAARAVIQQGDFFQSYSWKRGGGEDGQGFLLDDTPANRAAIEAAILEAKVFTDRQKAEQQQFVERAARDFGTIATPRAEILKRKHAAPTMQDLTDGLVSEEEIAAMAAKVRS